ncbi:MAG: hypothetical protein ABSF36_07010 [Candidatus Methanomethylicaceae archaeon]|jgi:hypothetical protein
MVRKITLTLSDGATGFTDKDVKDLEGALIDQLVIISYRKKDNIVRTFTTDIDPSTIGSAIGGLFYENDPEMLEAAMHTLDSCKCAYGDPSNGAPRQSI